MNRKDTLKATIASITIAGASVAVAMPALAGGDGNVVHNCFGRWYNTDWEQRCRSGGAGLAGLYTSDADCSTEADKQIYVNRSKNSTDVVDGPDCRFQANGVDTFYS